MRRKIGLVIILPLCLASCATRAPIGSLAWIDDLKVEPANVLAFKMNQHYPMPEIDVSINGKIASLELDTGTPHGFILTDTTVEEYGLEVMGVVRELNADGSDRGFDAFSVVADEVCVLGVESKRVKGTVSSWKVFSGFPFQGTISPEMLGKKRVIIDYKNRYLGLSDIGTPDSLSQEVNCAVKTLPIPTAYGSNVYFPGRIGGRDIVIYMDTGSSTSSIDPPVFAGLSLDGKRRGGQLWAQDVEFSIGNYTFILKKAVVGPILRGIDFDNPVGIALGADFLKDYIITIDSIGERTIVISRYQ
jgi:hypothetical protein